jgi:hypothetical protein
MRERQKEAITTRREFIDRSKGIIKSSIVELFNLNPHLESLRFNMDGYQHGHEYSEASRLWGFKVELHPNLTNYVDVLAISDRTLLRDHVGSFAVICRELRYALLEMFGTGLITLKRSDWLETKVDQVSIYEAC